MGEREKDGRRIVSGFDIILLSAYERPMALGTLRKNEKNETYIRKF